jgi:hypothetical protein
MKRKHILLRNEIELLQKFLAGEVYPADFWKKKLIEQLEELKCKWYKVKCVKSVPSEQKEKA